MLCLIITDVFGVIAVIFFFVCLFGGGGGMHSLHFFYVKMTL